MNKRIRKKLCKRFGYKKYSSYYKNMLTLLSQKLSEIYGDSISNFVSFNYIDIMDFELLDLLNTSFCKKKYSSYLN